MHRRKFPCNTTVVFWIKPQPVTNEYQYQQHLPIGKNHEVSDTYRIFVKQLQILSAVGYVYLLFLLLHLSIHKQVLRKNKNNGSCTESNNKKIISIVQLSLVTGDLVFIGMTFLPIISLITQK